MIKWLGSRRRQSILKLIRLRHLSGKGFPCAPPDELARTLINDRRLRLLRRREATRPWNSLAASRKQFDVAVDRNFTRLNHELELELSWRLTFARLCHNTSETMRGLAQVAAT